MNVLICIASIFGVLACIAGLFSLYWIWESRRYVELNDYMDEQTRISLEAIKQKWRDGGMT